MSTRSTEAHAVSDQVSMHLYDEMHDGCVHLEINLRGTYISLNLVIPKELVKGVKAIISQQAD